MALWLELFFSGPVFAIGFRCPWQRINSISLGKTAAAYGQKWERSYLSAFRPWFLRTSSHVVATREAVRRRDPQILMMERLGFRFTFDGKGYLVVDVPAFDHMLETYEGILQQHISSGRVAPEEALRPGRVFKDGAGQHHFLDFFHEPEAGWKEVDVSSRGDLVGQMIRKGLFPLMNNWRTAHDFAHLTALLQYPDYMGAVRKMLRKAKPGETRVRGGPLTTRFIHLYEALVLVPAEKKELLRSLLPSPFHEGEPDRLVTVKEVTEGLRKLSPNDLRKHARKLVATYPELVIAYGGAARELGAEYYNPHFTESPHVLLRKVSAALDRDPKILAHETARLEVALWESSRLTPADYEAQAGSPVVDPRSPLYRWMVLSGIGYTGEPRSETFMSLSLMSKPE